MHLTPALYEDVVETEGVVTGGAEHEPSSVHNGDAEQLGHGRVQEDRGRDGHIVVGLWDLKVYM